MVQKTKRHLEICCGLGIFFVILGMVLLLSGCNKETAKEESNSMNSSEKATEMNEETEKINDDVITYMHNKYYVSERTDGDYSIMFNGSLITVTPDQYQEYVKEVSEVLKDQDVRIVAKMTKTQMGVYERRQEIRRQEMDSSKPREHGSWQIDAKAAAYECEFVNEEAFIDALKEIFEKYKK